MSLYRFDKDEDGKTIIKAKLGNVTEGSDSFSEKGIGEYICDQGYETCHDNWMHNEIWKVEGRYFCFEFLADDVWLYETLRWDDWVEGYEVFPKQITIYERGAN